MPDNKDEILEGNYVVDERTGEQIVVQPKPPSAGMIVYVDATKVGTLDFSQDAIDVLGEPLDENDVLIRPDGLLFLPWYWFNKRLNRAFGFGKWGLVPSRDPLVKKIGNFDLIIAMHWLIVNGVPIAHAGGEMSYNPSNSTMSYGDAVEGARSNSLVRCCKQLGMALELFEPAWIDAWKEKYAETYKDKKGNTRWRKKGSDDGGTGGTEEAAVGNPQGASSGSVKAAGPVAPAGPAGPVESAETFTQNQILARSDLVEKISTETGQPVVKVCAYLGKLEKGQKFTVGQIIKALTPPQV